MLGYWPLRLSLEELLLTCPEGRVTLDIDNELRSFGRHLQRAASAELLPRAAPTGVFAWVLRLESSIKLNT